MCVRLKEMWAKVGLGHSYAFPACAVLEAEALSRARFLKYTVYCHLCHLDPARVTRIVSAIS